MIESHTAAALMLCQALAAYVLLGVVRIELRTASAGSARARLSAARWAFYGAGLWPLASLLPERLTIVVGEAQREILDLQAVSAGTLLNASPWREIALGLVLAAAAGVLCRFVLTARAVWRGEKLAAEARLRSPDAYGFDPRVRIGVSEHAAGPLVVGLRRSVIVIPPRLLDAPELVALLQHEYAHVLNGDVRKALIQRLFEDIFWWNPAMRTLGYVLAEQREMACDEIAAGRDERFALALAREARTRAEAHSVGLGGAGLERRLERLSAPSRRRAAPIIAVLALLAVGAFAAPRLDRDSITFIGVATS